MNQLSALPPPRPGQTPARPAETVLPAAHAQAFTQHLDAATQSRERPDRDQPENRRDDSGSATDRHADAGRSPAKAVAAVKPGTSATASDQPKAPAGTGADKPSPAASASASDSAPQAKSEAPSKDDSGPTDKPDAAGSVLVNTMLALISPPAALAPAGTSPVNGADTSTGEGKSAGTGNAGASALSSWALAGTLPGTAADSAAGTSGAAGPASGTAAVTLPATALDASVSAALAPLLAVNQLPDQKPLKELDTLQQSLAMLAPTTQGGGSLAGVQTLPSASTLDPQAFQQQLGQQVAWLSGQEIKQASIRLHPADLGQLDIKVSVTQGQVNVMFNAQHPAAVTAVQQTLPQLGHMLAQHGLALGHAEVGQHGNGNQSRQSRDRTDEAAASVHAAGNELVSSGTATVVSGVGLLDAFA